MNKSISKVLFILFVTSLIGGCVESEFHLAKESRLPIWFEIPDGMQREDLDVVLTYYTIGSAGITLIDARKGKSKSLKRIKGKNIHHPEYWEWAQKDWPKRSHPSFVVVTVNGVKEIIEHRRMEPIFYISNEAAVKNTISGKNTYNKRVKSDAQKYARALP